MEKNLFTIFARAAACIPASEFPLRLDFAEYLHIIARICRESTHNLLGYNLEVIGGVQEVENGRLEKKSYGKFVKMLIPSTKA